MVERADVLREFCSASGGEGIFYSQRLAVDIYPSGKRIRRVFGDCNITVGKNDYLGEIAFLPPKPDTLNSRQRIALAAAGFRDFLRRLEEVNVLNPDIFSAMFRGKWETWRRFWDSKEGVLQIRQLWLVRQK
ncbi:hypothetical protein A3F45_01215 [Candidatus Curtissbacteria bacterium RIFCSPHIGHO2_12_FULL_41_17]|uniref:Uncharacterized protein n=2 Tax=Candidatus Curtissiibacteriota TaxID=1752717 RepID=A0A1F5HKV5_9BACT|nr:MAG: hypothetical protein A2693_00790 [Candidatus Curtissbacteria bacterium RIFCSPHIGHO2_01_FULL_40_12]OGE04714.1 MAG: hypothetical protein A3F45_01215 [Candidatus Curtissbacteria bacterium RIFCSPHIGHO2_12_FULL_41_17]